MGGDQKTTSIHWEPILQVAEGRLVEVDQRMEMEGPHLWLGNTCFLCACCISLFISSFSIFIYLFKLPLCVCVCVFFFIIYIHILYIYGIKCQYLQKGSPVHVETQFLSADFCLCFSLMDDTLVSFKKTSPIIKTSPMAEMVKHGRYLTIYPFLGPKSLV